MSRPQPTPVPWDAGFWDGAREGRLRLQHCRHCDRVQHYPRPVCTACRGTDLDWLDSDGRGVIYSFTVVRVPLHPAFRDEAPLVLADVELPEGVRLLARLLGEGVEALDDDAIGAAVQVGFAPNQEGGMPVPCARLV